MKSALLAGAAVLVSACAREPAPAIAAPRSPPTAAAAVPSSPLPAPGWPYWQPVPVDVRAVGTAPRLPLDDAAIIRLEGAEVRWLSAPERVRAAVRDSGFSVWERSPHERRFGEFYAKLVRDRVPALVTLDTLFFLVHIARDRAFADVEARVLAPALDRLLRRLDARLSVEQKGAPADLLAAYRTARGIVAVALALETADHGTSASPDIAAKVIAEVAHVVTHEGILRSALLDLPVDYSMMAARGGFEEGDTRAGAFRAAAWLAYAPLAMIANTEQSNGLVDVGTARTQTRAALLLTRLLQADVDADAAASWTTMARLAELAIGHPADVAPASLFNIVRGAGLDLHDPMAIADVVRLDHARHAVGHARPGASFRLVGLRNAPDAAVLAALVTPRVVDREMPSALDVGAWLGSVEARTVLHEDGTDKHGGYAAALEREYTNRPPQTERHASFYLSALDGIASYVGTSAADSTFAAATSAAWRRHKLETALGAWTELRHDSLAYARIASGREPPYPHEIGTRRPEPVAVFVEPHPEAIARLVGLVRHITRGLTSMSALPPEAPSRVVLAEVEGILTNALAASLRATNDTVASPEDAAALKDLPARISAIEALVASSGADQTALVADVHTDEEKNLALEEATGELDDLFTVVREPGTGRPILAVGPALTHHEFEQPSAARLSDGTWRARLAREKPVRDSFTKTFVLK